MKGLKTIEIESTKGVTTIWLDRPEVHNAFNETMVEEITRSFIEINNEEETKLIVLRAKGKSFSAGADINWMKKVAGYSFTQNLKEGENLSKCFNAIYSSLKPTVAVVHGASFGGANGLIASCDFTIADKETVFSFSEVNIGIIPACISPYVIKRIGEYPARELMLTGQRFKGKKAQKIGLINKSCKVGKLEEELKRHVELIFSSSPKAVSACKELIHAVVEMSLEDTIGFTAEKIAKIRATEEGKEGLAAFLDKRKPSWSK